MFSTIMETVLVKFLGKYVDGIKNNMDVNIINGNVTIEKISLRPEFINELGLPFALKYSHISKILINVPWTNLKEKPTTVTIQGIYALLALKYDDMEDAPGNAAEKIKPIIARVKTEIKKKLEEKEAGKSETFAEKSIIRIIDNLIINIEDIHVRVESIKRNWYFSMGVVIDKITSFTVNEYGQKSFYVRHFTNKEANEPLKKSFNCERFEIYFNDAEMFFISEQEGKTKSESDEIKKDLLAEPFFGKVISSPSKKDKGSMNRLPSLERKQSYPMKIFSKFTFDFVIEQKLSSDKKYVVEVKGQLPKVNIKITDIQLSQIVVFLELIYEWVVDKEKNGRRSNIFDEKQEEYYKKVLLKYVKEEKVTDIEVRELYRIVAATPVSRLEDSADSLIKDYRIEKQMKKINKETNKEKSQQMIEKLFERLENENQEVLELFEHIVIQINMPELKVSCLLDNKTLLQIGFNTIVADIKLVLARSTIVNLQVSEAFIYQFEEENYKNLVKAEKNEYSNQPFIEFGLTKIKKASPIIKAMIKKRYICIEEQTLLHLINWVSKIKIKTPLVNFLDEQINYSIYITKEIFNMLFSDPDLSINLAIQIPVLAIKFKSLLEVDLGTLSVSRENEKEYSIEFTTRQSLCVDGEEILAFDEGNRICLQNLPTHTVSIELVKLNLQNIPKIFSLAHEIIKLQFLKELATLSPIVEEEIMFEGLFLLNEFRCPQKMYVKGNYLHFIPSREKIYLLRTKMYQFTKNGLSGFIFREEVEKEVNIVLMDSKNQESSNKLMSTLFETLKQHMLYICTIAQWKKYYQTFPENVVTEVSQIQKQEQNTSLIDLTFCLKNCNLNLGELKSGEFELQVSDMKFSVNYKEYNTDAEAEIRSMNLILGVNKIVENLSIGIKYSYVEYMAILVNVLMLKFNVESYEIIEQIVNYSVECGIMVEGLVDQLGLQLGPKVVEGGETEIEREMNEIENNSYLLENKIVLNLNNIEVYLIGFRNFIKSANVSVHKHRNNETPSINMKIDQIILISSLTIFSLQFNLSNNKIDLLLANFKVNLSYQLLMYELTSGRGKNFITSILNLVERGKSRDLALEKKKRKSGEGDSFPTFNVNVKGFRVLFKLTDYEEIKMSFRDIKLALNRNKDDRSLLDVDVAWGKYQLVINENMILEPISGQLTILAGPEGKVLKIGTKIEPILINVSINRLIESGIVIKLSIERLLNLELIKSMLVESILIKDLEVDKRGRKMDFCIEIESIKVLLYDSVDREMFRVCVERILVDTCDGKDNQIEVSLEYLNSIVRIYEPILEKTKIEISIKDGPQALIKLEEIHLNISEELVRELLKELIKTKNNLEVALKEIKFDRFEESSSQNELEKYKKILNKLIKPDEVVDQEDDIVNTIKSDISECTIIIRNCINMKVLVETKIDEQEYKGKGEGEGKGKGYENKKKIQLLPMEETEEVKFKIRSEYEESYQMIEKYKRVMVKITLLHDNFSTESAYFSIFLYKEAFTYHESKFYDDHSLEFQSAIGLFIQQQPNSSNYILEIISPYQIYNETIFPLVLNRVQGQQVYKKELKPGDKEWITPWIYDTVTVNLESDQIYASSHQMNLEKPEGIYEIALNSSSGNEPYNYCCLDISKSIFDIIEPYTDTHRKINHKLSLHPSKISFKPSFYIINHFHQTIEINGTECKHKQRTPLYSLFKSKEKKENFIKIKLGDNTTHEIILPKEENVSTAELKLENENYVIVSVLYSQNKEEKNKGNISATLHIFAKMELLLSFPKIEETTLYTKIYNEKYILKKEIIQSNTAYQHPHPQLINGTTQSVFIKDRFHFNTSINVLGEYEKYLEIKGIKGSNFYSKEITLYPSYYGDMIELYKNKEEDGNDEMIRKYSINYEFTKINNDHIMYYVSILPKYYIYNISQEYFSIDGNKYIKYNERIVIDSDEVEMQIDDTNVRWEMMSESSVVSLSQKKEVIFFKEILFGDHEINHVLKNKKRRKMSKSLEIEDYDENKNVDDSKEDQDKGQNINKSKSLDSSLAESSTSNVPIRKVHIKSENLKIFQNVKHVGSHGAITFCLKEWNEWISFSNNLDKTIIVSSSYEAKGLLISIETQINPGQIANHPYGIESMPEIKFEILSQEKEGESRERLEIGCYKTKERLNDEIELFTPATESHEEKVEIVEMYETRMKNGRKVILSFVDSNEKENKLKSMKSLIIPALLRISESLKITIESVNASVFAGQGCKRREILRLCSSGIDLTLLVYPSGLYMFQASLALELQAPQFPEPVLSVPNIKFYLEAMQEKFIERVEIKVAKEINVFLTDKFLYEILDVVMRNMKEVTNVEDVFNNDQGVKESDGFYTSSLNSVNISEIHAKVTMKKVLIEGSENQKKIIDMGVSIAELEGSGIKLSKVDIEEPINTNHINSITKMYVMEIIMGCLGGMNLIGNPKQFLEEIEAGTTRGMPVIGFVGGILAGTANSMSKILSTVSNSVSNLSMDYEFQRQRNELYLNQPKGFVNGVKQGSKSLVSSIKSGIVGLVEKPYEGAKEDGGFGFIKGSLEGLTGLFVKPVTGLMDATSMTIQGLRSVSSYNDKNEENFKGLEKPLYHRFRVIRSYDRVHELLYSSLIRIFRGDEKRQGESIELVEAVIIEDENDKMTEEGVIVTTEKLYLINYVNDTVELEIRNEKLVATGKFLEGIVLYYIQEGEKKDTLEEEEEEPEESEIIFRLRSVANAKKKEHLFETLKGFTGLYYQSKDTEDIPD